MQYLYIDCMSLVLCLRGMLLLQWSMLVEELMQPSCVAN